MVKAVATNSNPVRSKTLYEDEEPFTTCIVDYNAYDSQVFMLPSAQITKYIYFQLFANKMFVLELNLRKSILIFKYSNNNFLFVLNYRCWKNNKFRVIFKTGTFDL